MSSIFTFFNVPPRGEKELYLQRGGPKDGKEAMSWSVKCSLFLKNSNEQHFHFLKCSPQCENGLYLPSYWGGLKEAVRWSVKCLLFLKNWNKFQHLRKSEHFTDSLTASLGSPHCKWSPCSHWGEHWRRCGRSSIFKYHKYCGTWLFPQCECGLHLPWGDPNEALRKPVKCWIFLKYWNEQHFHFLQGSPRCEYELYLPRGGPKEAVRWSVKSSLFLKC